ncbi:hypothetical protein [Kitasatospora phosalacinea]|uniref:hypothetical protein n=1 Tax=Kitasatospora phosalacinea TaxID=2065 RepID=UPI00368CA4CE
MDPLVTTSYMAVGTPPRDLDVIRRVGLRDDVHRRGFALNAAGPGHHPVPVTVPMPVRTPGRGRAPRNAMAGTRIALPCDGTDPAGPLAAA